MYSNFTHESWNHSSSLNIIGRRYLDDKYSKGNLACHPPCSQNVNSFVANLVHNIQPLQILIQFIMLACFGNTLQDQSPALKPCLLITLLCRCLISLVTSVCHSLLVLQVHQLIPFPELVLDHSHQFPQQLFLMLVPWSLFVVQFFLNISDGMVIALLNTLDWSCMPIGLLVILLPSFLLLLQLFLQCSQQSLVAGLDQSIYLQVIRG